MFTTRVLPLSSKPSSLRRTKSVLCCRRSEPIDRAAQEDEAIPQDELDDKTENEAGIHEYVVSTGDTLSSVLNQYGIDMGNISQLAAADKDLRNLKIGQQLSWTLTPEGDLQRLTGKCPVAKRAPTTALQTVSK